MKPIWQECPICKREGDREFLTLTYEGKKLKRNGDSIPDPGPENTMTYLCTIHDDYCELCYEKLDDEDFFGEYETRGEFWGAPCSEYVTYGYQCHSCGETVNF